MTEDSISQVQSWINRLNTGDVDARDHLMTVLRDRWRGFARRALHGSHQRLEAFEQTDDLLSELSLRLLQDWKRGAVPATAADFFRQAANNFGNLLVDLCRKHYGRDFRRRRQLPLDAPGADTDAGPHHDPGTETLDPARLATWAEFHDQVNLLPPELRDVFHLRWYHDLTVPETAAALGIGERTVTKRWVEARLRLQTILQNSSFDDAAPP
jgi:RNA polymerase sigma factor (sigma-70 family)